MNPEKRFSKLLLSALALATILACLPNPFDPNAPAPITPTSATGTSASAPDLIYHNGVLLTMEQAQPQAQAIAILDDEILAVGTNEEILATSGPDTQVIDLGGQTLLPGFADGHSHMFWVPEGMTLDEVQDMVLSYGFTSVNEMTSDNGHLARLIQAEADGRLRLRVNVFPNFNSSRLDEYGNMQLVHYWYPENGPIQESEHMLRVPGIKIFVDGAGTPGRGCPAMREPYHADTRSQDWFDQICGSEYGDLYWTQEELNQAVADAQDAGYRVAFHAMGDKGIETALDAIAFALDGQSNSSVRHQIQHSSFLEQDLLERYIEDDILSSVRGHFNTCDQDDYHNDAAANRYALPGQGVHAYLETDARWARDPEDTSWSSTINSMVQLWGLVTHEQLLPDGTTCTPDPWIAQHVITVDQALRMMTYEPIYAVSQEEVLGSLAPGKFADLVILSADPHAVDPNDLKDLKVWMTMVGGRVEYCAAGHETICPGLQSQISSPEEPDGGPTESSIEPVTIKLFKEEQLVAAGTPIQLTIGWATDTEEQVADFLGAVSLTGTLDGQPLTDLDDYWGEIEPFESNYGDQEDYLSNWLYPLGVLSPGTHVVEIQATLYQPVTDGFDSNNDGQPDEYSGEVWQLTVRIEVEE